MAKLQQRGATWFGERIQSAAGQAVTYSRKLAGGVASVTVTGTVTQRSYEHQGDEGLVTTWPGLTWQFFADELVLEGSAITPQNGDRIAGTFNGEAVTCEVLEPGGRPCVEWADTAGILFKVHSKRVG